MANKWEYCGDVDVLSYGGTFIRHVGDRRYHAIRFTNMDDACGSDNEGRATYDGSLVEVDLDTADLDSARSCIGSDDDASDLELAYAVCSYGEYAPLTDEVGNNGNAIIANLKRASREIEGDAERYETLMATPVNLLGQTAREFQSGDMKAALDRGLRAGNEGAGIMAIMGRQRQPVSLGLLEKNGTITGAVSVDMSLTGSDDPMAFSYGFSQGMRGEAIATDDDLAVEYVRGHAEGLKVHKGSELPSFATLG